jgi:hypothetical protein
MGDTQRQTAPCIRPISRALERAAGMQGSGWLLEVTKIWRTDLGVLGYEPQRGWGLAWSLGSW